MGQKVVSIAVGGALLWAGGFATMLRAQPVFSPVALQFRTEEAAPVRVLPADVNLDGLPDIISIRQDGHVRVSLRSSDGTYETSELPGRAHISPVRVGSFLYYRQLIGTEVPDVAVVSDDQRIVFVYENHGDGTFSEPVEISYETYLHLTELATLAVFEDLNGSGFLDLAFFELRVDYAHEAFNTKVIFFENNGILGFTRKDSLDVPMYVFSGASADLNRDGLNDLIFFTATGAAEETVFVYLNHEDFQFAPTSHQVIAGNPTDWAAADVNADGHTDLLVTGLGEGACRVLYGKGDGTFEEPQALDLEGRQARAVAAGDMDGDGRPEVGVATEAAHVELFAAGGNGELARSGLYLKVSPDLGVFPAQDLAFYDADGDDNLDVVGAGMQGIFLLAGDGSGRLTSAWESSLPLTDLTPWNAFAEDSLLLVAAHLNSDNLPDVVATTSTSIDLAILLSKPSGGFEEPRSLPLHEPIGIMRRGDLEADGLDEVFVADLDGAQISILRSDGQGNLGLLRTMDLPSPVADFVVVDLNGDGAADLAECLRNEPSLNILVGDGAGHFAPSQTIALRDTANAIVAADLNGDGKLDLAAGLGHMHFDQPPIAVYLGSGDGTFREGFGASGDQGGFSPLALRRMLATDYDGDGATDVILLGLAWSELLRNDGSGQMSERRSLDPELGYGLCWGDFTGDGLQDLATVSGPSLTLYRGEGDGVYELDFYQYPKSGLWGVPVARDFNGDGFLDVVVLSANPPTLTAFYGTRGVRTDGVVLRIVAPTGTVQTGSPITPEVLVRNGGLEEWTGILRLTIGDTYSDSLSVTLAPGEERSLSLREWTPQATGVFAVLAELFVPGDQVLGNNTLSATVEVVGAGPATPRINYVRPDGGGNSGIVRVTIHGAHFQRGAEVLLRREGEPDIVADSLDFLATRVVSESEIEAVFDLEGAATGLWDIEIRNPDGGIVRQPGAFRVEKGRKELWVDMTGPEIIRYMRPVDYRLFVGNRGNVYINYVIPFLILPKEWALDSLTIIEGFFAQERLLVDGELYQQEGVELDTLYLFIRNLAPGEMVRFRMYGRGIEPTMPKQLRRPAKVEGGTGFGFGGAALASMECLAKNAVKIQVFQPKHPEKEWNKAFGDALETFATGVLTDLVKTVVGIFAPEALLLWEVVDIASNLINAAKDVGQFNVFDLLLKLLGISTSMDPNYKAGPAGFGDEGFVTGGRPFYYTIHFENLDSATAPAENIVIADTLDPHLDWASLAIERASHPGLAANFDSTEGVLTLRYEGINLPPNKTPPEGEGWVEFRVMPRGDLQTYDRITNRASIVFDYNEPILTPLVLNTIDISPPVSRVEPLDPVQRHVAFRLKCSGSDEGAGIAWYRIYVAEDGGDYTLWKESEDGEALFIGRNGHRYEFFSQAVDHVGNREPLKTSADVAVEVQAEEEIGVNPNPFVPARGDEHIVFFGGSLANASLEIYTISGLRVATLQGPSEGTSLVWDARNDRGEALASGVYIWVLKTDHGTFRGKFSIVR